MKPETRIIALETGIERQQNRIAELAAEVARLTEERDRLTALAWPARDMATYYHGLIIWNHGDDESKWPDNDGVRRYKALRDRLRPLQFQPPAPAVELAQQREDIRRLLVAVEAVCAKACLTGRNGEDGYTYQVGRDGDAALRALAVVRDELAVKYPKGDE